MEPWVYDDPVELVEVSKAKIVKLKEENGAFPLGVAFQFFHRKAIYWKDTHSLFATNDLYADSKNNIALILKV